jgi:hypothetical protein
MSREGSEKMPSLDALMEEYKKSPTGALYAKIQQAANSGGTKKGVYLPKPPGYVKPATTTNTMQGPSKPTPKNIPQFKKGGKVKKTGPIMAHKGEYVLPASVKPTKKQVSKVSKLRKRK